MLTQDHDGNSPLFVGLLLLLAIKLYPTNTAYNRTPKKTNSDANIKKEGIT